MSLTGLAQQRAADGVTINDEGLPQYSTFSLCAIDPATGQSGATVTTRVPFVGRAVPHVRAGIGAVCTQASTMVEYGPRGLDLLAKGVEPAAAIAAAAVRRSAARIAAGRRDRHERPLGGAHRQGQRQLGGQPAGPELHGAGQHHGRPRGRRSGRGDVRSRPRAPAWPLAERMILAMEAGQAKGGDRRWGNLQSAAIKIADPNNPGRGGDYIALAIEVGEHAEPVGEMKRIYYTTARRLGYRTFSRVEGPDVRRVEADAARARLLAADARGISGRAAGDEHAELQELRKTNPAAYDKAVAEARQATADYTRDFATFDDEAIAAVDKFRTDRKLNYQGNPPGWSTRGSSMR